MNSLKSIIIFLLMGLQISCSHQDKPELIAPHFELTIKDYNSLKSYKMINNGLFLNLVNKSGENGILWEGEISADRYSAIDGFLNRHASFKSDTTIASWKSDENCSDEPLYRLIFHNKYNKEIVFTGSSCVKHTAMDSLVFSTVRHLDSVAKHPYFNSFEQVAPPPPPF
jgi:hypothetical protein